MAARDADDEEIRLAARQRILAHNESDQIALPTFLERAKDRFRRLVNGSRFR